MQLRDETDIAAGARINRNDRFRANLKVFSGPDNARVDCPRSLSPLPAIKWGFNGKLDERNQMIERRPQADVLHLLLQVDEVVFHSKAVLQHVRMAFNIELPFARFSIGTECARACASGNRNADDASDRKRTKYRQTLWQIAQALTKEQRWSPCAECVRSHSPVPGAADFHTATQRKNGLVFIILEKLIFGAEFEIAKATH